MFVHIGADVVVPSKDIIGIFDLENTTISKDTKEFLKIAEEEGFVESVSSDLPKSFIIAEIDSKSKVLLSPISSITLKKRTSFVDEISNNYLKQKPRK